jgi:1-acyl-sn-glycerol-3-phosphate acyltransferase
LFLYWLGKFWLWLFGWKVQGYPPLKKCVVVIAPHTSNWDFPFMLAISFVLRVQASWLGKHTLFAPPFGWILRWLGGIPVDRRASHSFVEQLAEKFATSEDLVLAMAPEGTRRKVDFWKSGFYYIALKSRVPIGLAFADYQRKLCGLGAFVTPTGNVSEDMNLIREFYRNISGKVPHLQSEPRLREEFSEVSKSV